MELLTVKQAAEMLTVSVGTVRNLLRRKELPSLRIGRQIRFVREDLERWIRLRVRPVRVPMPPRRPESARRSLGRP